MPDRIRHNFYCIKCGEPMGRATFNNTKGGGDRVSLDCKTCGVAYNLNIPLGGELAEETELEVPMSKEEFETNFLQGAEDANGTLMFCPFCGKTGNTYLKFKLSGEEKSEYLRCGHCEKIFFLSIA